jgi:hypothetical protein
MKRHPLAACAARCHAGPISSAVWHSIHANVPWQARIADYALYRALARNSESERGDFDAAVERLWFLCRLMVAEHERS